MRTGRIGIGCALLLLCAAISSCSDGTPVAPTDPHPYRWILTTSEGPSELTLAPARIAVLIDGDSYAEPLASELGAKCWVLDQDLHVPGWFMLRKAVSDADRRQVEGVAGVLKVNPVFRDHEVLTVLTDEIIVRFRDGVTEEDKARFFARWGLAVKRIYYEPELTIVRPAELLGFGDDLILSNAMNGDGVLKYSQPNFIHFGMLD